MGNALDPDLGDIGAVGEPNDRNQRAIDVDFSLAPGPVSPLPPMATVFLTIRLSIVARPA
jgi:hypothetical protein